MVSNVAKLTRSLRKDFLHREPNTRNTASDSIEEQRSLIHHELRTTGEAIFVDEKGNRFRIERRPA